MEDQEVIKEFLIESNENLGRLDQEMVELERRPDDAALLASVFRTFHTIKGTCGFLGFNRLERIAHQAENVLAQLRSGKLALNRELASLVLRSVDALRRHLLAIETCWQEAPDDYAELCRSLEGAAAGTLPGAGQAAAESRPPLASAPEQPPVQEQENSGQKPQGGVADSAIRVDVHLLDRLMNLVGELVLTRNQILQFTTEREGTALGTTSQRLNLITSELQENVMKTRMQPIGVVWNKLPRVVRDLAMSCNKQVALEMEGADTELDKTIIEAIKDPLTHIVRNCCDHGIERPELRAERGKPPQGRLSLRASHEGGQVIIEIADDGGGVDLAKVIAKAVQSGIVRPDHAERMSEREALNLLFLPGFSTAEKVTNVSGRGVGMDVVRTNTEKIGGTVDISSRPGEGTTVKLKIPLTLAIIPGLVVSLAGPGAQGLSGQQFVIPQVSLVELVRLEGDAARRSIERIRGTAVYRLRGNLLPIVYLRDVLGLEGAGGNSEVVNFAVLQAEDRQFGLVVDAVKDTQEIVVKPLGKHLKGLNWYAGATIMGDGRVALILDVLGIAQRSGEVSAHRERARVDAPARQDASEAGRQTFLLFRAGPFERVAVPLSLVARLEEFPRARIERAGNRLVVQYRDRILPLVPLAPILDSAAGDSASHQDPVQAVVFDDGERRIGMLVDRLVDIVDDAVAVRQASARPGLLGSAVIGGRVTDLVDLDAVLAAAAGASAARETSAHGGATVLLAAGSPFERGTLRVSLEMAGYRVVEAASADEARRLLGRTKVDLVIAALDLPGGPRPLVEQMRREPSLAAVPVVAIAGQEADGRAGPDAALFEECLARGDREAMIRSIERLAGALAAQQAPPEPAELTGAKG